MEQERRTDRNRKRNHLMLCTWKPVNTSNELNKRASNSYHIQPHEALSNDATGCNDHDGAVSWWQHNSICLKRRAPCAICRQILALRNQHFRCCDTLYVYAACYKAQTMRNIRWVGSFSFYYYMEIFRWRFIDKDNMHSRSKLLYLGSCLIFGTPKM
jgi:hypothetical protein